MAMGKGSRFSSSVHVLLLAVALVLVCAVSLAQDSTPIVGFGVQGEVYCTVDGNPVAGIKSKGAANANVSVSCDGGKTTLAAGVTNEQGQVNITVSPRPADLVQTVVDLVDGECVMNVFLPIANCTDSKPNGTLAATLTVTSPPQPDGKGYLRAVLGKFKYVAPAPR